MDGKDSGLPVTLQHRTEKQLLECPGVCQFHHWTCPTDGQAEAGFQTTKLNNYPASSHPTLIRVSSASVCPGTPGAGRQAGSGIWLAPTPSTPPPSDSDKRGPSVLKVGATDSDNGQKRSGRKPGCWTRGQADSAETGSWRRATKLGRR